MTDKGYSLLLLPVVAVVLVLFIINMICETIREAKS